MTSVFRSVANLFQPAAAQDAVAEALRRTPARHKEASVIASADDEIATPTRRLMEVALAAARRACDVELSDLEGRTSSETR
jgi:hypothetical protein